MELQDYRNFCNAQLKCEDCPFAQMGYTNCFGFITNEIASAEKIIKDWKDSMIKSPIFIIVDKYSDGKQAIQGAAFSRQAAENIIEQMALSELHQCIGDVDCGIDWENMTSNEQEDFFENQIKSTWEIAEIIIDNKR